MKSTLTKKEDNLVSLNIVVPAKEADSAYNMAVSRISQHINIDGFRKGKAPMNIVEKYYGAEIFYEDAFNEVAPEELETALKENKININKKIS